MEKSKKTFSELAEMLMQGHKIDNSSLISVMQELDNGIELDQSTYLQSKKQLGINLQQKFKGGTDDEIRAEKTQENVLNQNFMKIWRQQIAPDYEKNHEYYKKFEQSLKQLAGHQLRFIDNEGNGYTQTVQSINTNQVDFISRLHDEYGPVFSKEFGRVDEMRSELKMRFYYAMGKALNDTIKFSKAKTQDKGRLANRIVSFLLEGATLRSGKWPVRQQGNTRYFEMEQQRVQSNSDITDILIVLKRCLTLPGINCGPFALMEMVQEYTILVEYIRKLTGVQVQQQRNKGINVKDFRYPQFYFKTAAGIEKFGEEKLGSMIKEGKVTLEAVMNECEMECMKEHEVQVLDAEAMKRRDFESKEMISRGQSQRLQAVTQRLQQSEEQRNQSQMQMRAKQDGNVDIPDTISRKVLTQMYDKTQYQKAYNSNQLAIDKKDIDIDESKPGDVPFLDQSEFPKEMWDKIALDQITTHSDFTVRRVFHDKKLYLSQVIVTLADEDHTVRFVSKEGVYKIMASKT